jgi:peroxiredoxin
MINGYAGEKPAISNEDKEGVGLAPNFKLRDLYKFEYTLSDYRDKQPVVLFFWTTWCPFCRKELTTLNNRYLELVRSGIELFAIDVGESAEKVDRTAKSYSLAFKVLLDQATLVAQAYNILGVPTYVLIDKKGRIVFTGNNFPEAKYKESISK